MGMVITFANTYNHLSKEHFRTLDGLDSSIRVVPLGVPSPEWAELESLPYAEHVHELVPEVELLVEKLFARQADAPPACIISDMFLGCFQVIDFFQTHDIASAYVHEHLRKVQHY